MKASDEQAPARAAGVASAALDFAFVAALGALQTPAFVYPRWGWPLPLLALALLVWRLDAAAPRRAALLGWGYGCGWLGAGVWWLFISLHYYGGLPAALAVLAVAALCMALSLYPAAACAAYARWRRGSGADVALFAALWLLAELARGVLFTGFPWVAGGYSQVDSPLAVLAPWAGVYGIGALLAAAAVALLRLVQAARPAASARTTTLRRAALPAAAVTAVVVAAHVAPHEFTRPAGDLQVVLLQTRVEQDEKFAADRMPQALDWLARELAAAQGDLVVTPETAVPLLPGQLAEFAPGYWDALSALFDGSARAALVGIPLGDYQTGYANSVLGLGGSGQAGGRTYRYDKTHLVPFGEFIPTGFRWFTEAMSIPLGDFTRGAANPPSFAVRGQRVAPNICYEDLFGEELARRFVDAAQAPTMLVNVSNIGWFGDTIAVPQHLQISRLRTLELQRPMLRATNTGATAAIDHRGNVVAALDPRTRGALSVRVQGRDGTTPYAWWAGRVGLWPLWVAALAVLGTAMVRRAGGGRSG